MLSKLLSFSRYPEFLRLLRWRVLTPFLLKKRGVQIGRGVEFFGQPLISMVPGSLITIGDKASLCSVSEFTALGVNHPVILRTLRAGARIEIGADTGISGGSLCAASRITIGKQCLFGANVTITDTDFHPTAPENRRYNNDPKDIGVAAVSIGDNVFIGTGVVVLKGVHIGDNAVIGAGAVVTRSVPANAIAIGNPARVVRMLQTVGGSADANAKSCSVEIAIPL